MITLVFRRDIQRAAPCYGFVWFAIFFCSLAWVGSFEQSSYVDDHYTSIMLPLEVDEPTKMYTKVQDHIDFMYDVLDNPAEVKITDLPTVSLHISIFLLRSSTYHYKWLGFL